MRTNTLLLGIELRNLIRGEFSGRVAVQCECNHTHPAPYGVRHLEYFVGARQDLEEFCRRAMESGVPLTIITE